MAAEETPPIKPSIDELIAFCKGALPVRNPETGQIVIFDSVEEISCRAKELLAKPPLFN